MNHTKGKLRVIHAMDAHSLADGHTIGTEYVGVDDTTVFQVQFSTAEGPAIVPKSSQESVANSERLRAAWNAFPDHYTAKDIEALDITNLLRIANSVIE